MGRNKHCDALSEISMHCMVEVATNISLLTNEPTVFFVIARVPQEAIESCY